MISFVRLGWNEACERLAPLVGNPKWDWSCGMYGVHDIIGDGVAYEVRDERGALGLVVLARVEHEYGLELVVRAALQLRGDGDIVERVLPEVEREFGPRFKVLTVYTKRAGLVKKMEAAGYSEAAKIMRKTL
jgi:hypothetical protein